MSQPPPFVEGEVVELEVERAHTFGLFCRGRGAVVLVRITDLSHLISVNSAAQFAAPGDRLTARIIWTGDERQPPVANVKAAYPAGDPATGGWLHPGAEFDATVVRPIKDALRCEGEPSYLVALRPGAYALLCGSDLALRAGDVCHVRAAEVSEDRRVVRLVPTGRAV